MLALQGKSARALAKPGETRFGTHYTCLQSLLYAKPALKKLFMYIEEHPADIPEQSRKKADGIKVNFASHVCVLQLEGGDHPALPSTHIT